MNIDIFIRTYPKDYEILKYCLFSIEKNLSGYNKIIICVRDKDLNTFKNIFNNKCNSNSYKIVTDHDFPDDIDYLGQQTSKLNADHWTDAEYLCYIDSDCIFDNPVDISKYFFDENNKINMLYEEWKYVGDAIMWKKCLNYLGLLTKYEFMRRLPQIYPVKILTLIRKLISEKTNKDFINGSILIYKNYQFSEFNIMGAYLYKNFKNEINFINSKEIKNICVQLWSYINKDQLIKSAISILNLNTSL